MFESMAMVTSDLALETVLDAVSRQMVEALKADLCLISRWHPADNQLCLMQCYAAPGARRPQKTSRSVDESALLSKVLNAQTPTLLQADAPNLTAKASAWLTELNTQTLLLIPLIYRRQTIGLVEMGRVTSADPLTPHEIRLAETMTAQAASAIEHARLYDDTIHHLAEARVLQEVMVAAASSLDFDKVLDGTIHALHRTLGIERLGFFLPTKDGNYVIPHPATMGFDLPNGQVRVPVDGSAAGWVIRQRKPLLLRDVRQAEAGHYYELAADTRSEVCVPVMVNGQVAAVLNAESSRVNAFDQDDLRLFTAIAAELAVALENTRLFEEIRAAEAKYRDLFDNANDFIFTLDSHLRVSSVNKVTLKATGYHVNQVIGAHITRFARPKHRAPALSIAQRAAGVRVPGHV